MTLLTLVLDRAWSISSDDFEAALKKRWPNVVVTRLDVSQDFSLRWEHGEPGVWEGQLSNDGCGLAMDGTLDGAARVASWFRELIPAEHAVWFLDVGNNAQIDVPSGTLPEAIADSFLKAANS